MNTRLKNCAWAPGDDTGNAPTWERVGVAVMLDIRDELQRLNSVMHCWETQSIPRYLREISATLKRIEADDLPSYCHAHPRYRGKSEPRDCRTCKRVRRLVLSGK